MNIPNPEKNNLLNKFNEELLKEKAKEMGVSPDEILVKVVNGKQVFLKKAEVYAQLEKQRSFTKPKQIPRALRGPDSLINKINEEVQTCLSLNAKLSGQSILNAMEAQDYRSSVKKLNDLTLDLARQLSEAENAIEQTKAADSVFKEAESVLIQMKQAHHQDDIDAVKDLQSNHAPLLKQYENRRKKLTPYLDAARQLRLEIQRVYWRLLVVRWKLLNHGVKDQLKRLVEASESMRPKEARSMFTLGNKDARDIAEQLNNEQISLSNQSPDKSTEIKKASDQYDRLTPGLIDLLETQHSLWQDLAAIELKEVTETQDGKSVKRMAYAARER